MSDIQTTQSAELDFFRPTNVQAIASLAPAAYSENTISHSRCLKAGADLLEYARVHGMNDDLDQQIAKYIVKAKATVKKMNDKRSPVTKLFDQLRSAYTTLENEVDPAKAATIPGQLQALRNKYAAQKRQEEERRRAEELARQMRQQAADRYRAEALEDMRRQYNGVLAQALNDLTSLLQDATLENYDQTLAAVRNFPCELPEAFGHALKPRIPIPLQLTEAECDRIVASALSESLAQWVNQFFVEVSDQRDSVADRLPSKKAELQRLAKASAEEAERIKAQMAEREMAEAARREQELAEKQRQERAAAELAAQKTEMDGLFGLPTAQPVGYQPKAQVRKRIVVDSPDSIMAIVAFWWSQKGCALPIEELAKTFKSQITFAEKAANDKASPTFIDGVKYEDEVKAK